ncbi:MAG TPA: sigma-70 family RNA polymerase sigma factor [Bacteroidia bacterium]|jgi:RNA polymerase sigma factor (sigma-70 family)|nr:sigma-70 family RNA polymerase sigma factor [Bacteroidia bacterium]
MENQITPDDELIHLYQNGNEDAFCQLLERYKKKVFGYILNVVRDRAIAEDIFQETFFKVIRTLKKQQYNGEGKFIQWVIRIAHNLIIDSFRQNGKISTVSKIVRPDGKVVDVFDVVKVEQGSAEDNMIKKQILQDIRKLVEHLPYEQREVVILRHYYDLSFKEIADMTNVSINTALGRMRYAIINLRRLAEQHKIALSE